MTTATTTQASAGRAAIHQPRWAVLLAAAGVCGGLALPGAAVASQALAQKYTCVACHQPAARTAGPSWKEIGAWYGADQGAATRLAASIKAGSSGKWGAMPMPPQMQVSDADAETLAQWLVDGAK